MLELKRKSVISLISKGMRILKLSVNRIAALTCSRSASASSTSWMSVSRKPFQKQNRGSRYKKYIPSFLYRLRLFGSDAAEKIPILQWGRFLWEVSKIPF